MELTVADLVEAQVARSPSAIAVTAGKDLLTYRELDNRANRLAERLQALDVGPGSIVGVCLGRSVDLAVGLLGVVKAGGACLPLDPALPRDRLAFMVDDAAPVVLLSSPALTPRLPGDARVIQVDGAGAESVPTPPRTAGPDDAAYVIYTSGSTGAPKGVLLTHGGLVNHHRAAVDMYGLGPGDRVLQFCSLGFDASIEELFPTWASGATVVFRPDDVPLLGRSWSAWLRESAITVLNLPTAYWHEWTRDLIGRGDRIPEPLRLVVVGGERASGSSLQAWAGAGGDGARWVNAYGPTEATCMATTWEATFTEIDGSDPPIGRPLPNVTARMVDRCDGPVEPGKPGELQLGGAGLARGYLNRPELTAERFVGDPAGGRWYRTGDIVRQRPDGELEYVGRVDNQIKVHGFRVELEEIEAVLSGQPGIVDAAVVAAEGRPGETRLVAYVVATGAGCRPPELRRRLADRLPAYMVPATIVAVDSLPRNENGKVDRSVLAAQQPTVAARPAVPPRTPAETRVAAIWARVLGIDVGQIGVDDDFFELGGHSLLAMQVIADIREEFGTATPVQAVIDSPTVAALAAVVAGEVRLPRTATRPPLAPRPPGTGPRLPLCLAQEQMWGLETAADPPGLYNITALQRLPRPVDERALRQTLAFLVSRHEALRTSVSADADGPYQMVHPAVAPDLAVTDLGGVDPADRNAELQSRLAAEDARAFATELAPLFRAHLFHVEKDWSQLAVTFDHLVCDGTAAYVFLDELAGTYRALTAGRLPDLPPLVIQPADFAVWQRAHATEDVLRGQVQWWTEALGGMPIGPVVAFDNVPATPTRRIASRVLACSPEVRRRLQEVARSTGSTVFVVAAAAVASVLGRRGGATDVVLSTTLSGRSRPQLDGLIGMFSGIGRIRTDLSGDPTFAQVVERTRRFLSGMYENLDVPFMRVRRELLPYFPRSGLQLAAALPVEFQYFRAAGAARAPGAAFIDQPGTAPRNQELFFRGQLHPLSITLLDDGTELWGEVSFKVDFYDQSTIEGLADNVEAVLDAVGRDPSRRVASLLPA